MAKLYDKASMQEHITMTSKVFGVSGKKEYFWQADSLLDLVEKLVAVWPDDGFSASLGSLCPCGADCQTDSKNFFISVLKLMSKVGHVMMTAAWIDQKFFCDQEGVLREGGRSST